MARGRHNITTIDGARGSTYRIRWTDSAGERQSANFDTEADAKRELREREREAEDIRNGRVKVTVSTPLFKKFAAEFMETVAKPKNKPSEYVSKEKSLRLNILPVLGDRQIHTINTADVDALAASLLAEGYAKKTANNVLVHLRRILGYAKRIGVTTSIPHFEMFKVMKKPIRFLTFEELDQLVGSITGPVLAMILLGADAGLRSGEIRALHWEDLDLQAGRLTVHWNEYRGSLGSPKGGRDRTVPLTPRLRASLQAIRADRALVFCGDTGELLTESASRHQLTQAKRAAKLPGFGWHTLRHTFCSHLMMLGANVRVIQELAGHADLATTLRYLHLAPNNTADAIGLLASRLDQIRSKTS